eukprot:g43524.t1
MFSMLAFIAQSFENRSWAIMLRMYRILLWPLLEYCIQFWSPCYRKDFIKLERVQKKFDRMLLGMEGLIYKERLDRLGLFSLEHRRLRGDLIEVYKIMSRECESTLNPFVGATVHDNLTKDICNITAVKKCNPYNNGMVTKLVDGVRMKFGYIVEVLLERVVCREDVLFPQEQKRRPQHQIMPARFEVTIQACEHLAVPMESHVQYSQNLLD